MADFNENRFVDRRVLKNTQFSIKNWIYNIWSSKKINMTNKIDSESDECKLSRDSENTHLSRWS